MWVLADHVIVFGSPSADDDERYETMPHFVRSRMGG
jgi:hypothetical protein